MKKFLLVGNANTGKTTLLNNLTKSHEHTGNWHGVTVEEKERCFNFNGQDFAVVDLPGIYSLTALSCEEQVSIDFVFKNSETTILNTCDINNLHRNLYLTLELLSLGREVILLVNTMGKKNVPNFDELKKKLGVEIFAISFDSKKDVNFLKQQIFNIYKSTQPKKNNATQKKDVQLKIIKEIYSAQIFSQIYNFSKTYSIDLFSAIKILEKDENYILQHNLHKIYQIINKNTKNNKENILQNHKNLFLDKNLNKTLPTNPNNNDISLDILAGEKFAFIKKCFSVSKKKKAYGEELLDKIFLNKFLAIPMFLGIMLLIFYVTFFSVGAYLTNILSVFVQDLFGTWLIDFFKSFCTVDWINGLVEFGIIGGVGSLISFLPQIVFLFLFLAILEDSGYFARIAFCFEDLFKKIGLSGKSIYTLLMGFGCSASAVLTARNMDSKNAKIKTAILTPYMSCSAKLPIYAVLGGAFFGAGNIFIIFMLYLLGIFVSLFVSVILDKFGLKTIDSAFILEFPPYRISKPKRILALVWQNMKLFLIKVSTIFISMNIIIWCLSSFSFSFSYVPISGDKSMIRVVGEFLAPIFAPLGFNNWGAVSALLAGIVAKEIVVSSLAIFNGIRTTGTSVNEGGAASGEGGLSGDAQISASLTNPASAVHFTAASALSYMSFCLLYCPCLATIAVLNKEIGFKWTFISIIIQLFVAYLVAFCVFNFYGLVESFGIISVLMIAAALFAIIISLICVFSHLSQKNKCKNCGLCG